MHTRKDLRTAVSSIASKLALGGIGFSIVAAAAMTSLSQACTITTGGSPLDGGNFQGNPSPPGSPPLPPTQSNASSCNSCLFSQCTGQWSLCDTNTECMAIYTCATAPGCSGDCPYNCYMAHPNGQADYSALANCDSTSACGACASQCTPSASACTTQPTTDDAGTTVSDAGIATDAGGENLCTACTDSQCQTEKAACGAGSDCEAYQQCTTACESDGGVDLTCLQNCGNTHSKGQTDLTNLSTCTTKQCCGPCNLSCQ